LPESAMGTPLSYHAHCKYFTRARRTPAMGPLMCAVGLVRTALHEKEKPPSHTPRHFPRVRIPAALEAWAPKGAALGREACGGDARGKKKRRCIAQRLFFQFSEGWKKLRLHALPDSARESQQAGAQAQARCRFGHGRWPVGGAEHLERLRADRAHGVFHGLRRSVVLIPVN